jgi:hypothetical protein
MQVAGDLRRCLIIHPWWHHHVHQDGHGERLPGSQALDSGVQTAANIRRERQECSLSQAPRSGRRPAEVAVIGSDRRSIGAKLRTKPFALTHAGSQNTAIVAATCRLTAVGLPCFSLQRTSTRGFLSIIIHLLQPGKSWFALLPLQALDLLTGRLTIAYSISSTCNHII